MKGSCGNDGKSCCTVPVLGGGPGGETVVIREATGSLLTAIFKTRRFGVNPLVANEMGPILLVIQEAFGRCRGVTVVPKYQIRNINNFKIMANICRKTST